MANQDDLHSGLNLADRATLDLLSALEDEGDATQRSLAKRIGVALGLTNSLLKRAVRKGLVKVKDAPARRYAYYVTPKGFREKSRLVAEYLSSSLDFFRHARDEYGAVFSRVAADGRRAVVLYGSGDLAEIAGLSARDMELDLLAIVEPGSNSESFGGLPVYPSLDHPDLRHVDAVVLSHAAAPQAAYDALSRRFGAAQIYAPSFLHVSRNAREVRK